MERKRQFFCVIIFVFAILFPITIFNLRCSSSLKFPLPIKENRSNEHLVSDDVEDLPTRTIPRLAYLISGSQGDGMQIRRTLQSLYHPQNYYVLHLDLKAPPLERETLSAHLRNDSLFQKIGNVVMVEKANLVTYRGPTMVAETLHGAAILLKKFKDWDWFINLSASDYPLTTQDDLLHVFSQLPRDLNFIEHTTELGWKFGGRAKPIIIDPSLYLDGKHGGNILETKYSRELPTQFKLFTGSAWAILSRSFVEYTVMGWDNLPRLLLMYYTNFVSSPEHYFHTVVCNSADFKNTTVNHDMHYIAWDSPPKQHPLALGLKDFGNLTRSGAPFARKFRQDDPVLDMIDKELLGGRAAGKYTPGGWCRGGGVDDTGGSCSTVMQARTTSFLQPGPGAKKLQRFIGRLLEEPKFRSQQCDGA